MKKIISMFLIVALLASVIFVFSGCEKSENTNTTANTTTKKSTTKSSTQNTNSTKNKESEEEEVDFKANAEKQMAVPAKGEQVAVFHIKDYGDVKVKFFPEVAPKAVENFVTHAKNGYYNGLTFHRIIDEFMIQGGDPEGTGMGGESIWGQGFGTELDYSLVPYRGALCMAMSNMPNSIGSQFFIEQAHPDTSFASQMKQGGYPDSFIEQYNQYGGSPHLYMQFLDKYMKEWIL